MTNINTAQLKAAMNSISLSPITISGSGGQTLYGAASQWQTTAYDLETMKGQHELLRKYEVYESTENLLALSVASHRLMRDSKIYYKVTDREIFNKVNPEDRIMADQIKDYYSKKVMMWKLKGNGQLSRFREDMNKLIHSDMLTFKENMIGIAYWLPYFYHYDIDMDIVKSQLTTNQNFEQMNKDGKPGVLRLTEELIPLKRLERKSKRTKSFEYWFKNAEYDAGVVIHLEEKNQLQHLWDTIFNKKEPLKIEGYYTRRHRDDFEYYTINNWKLA